MKNWYEKIKDLAYQSPRLAILFLAFFYVLLTGLFIQLIFLPQIAPPSMSRGDGLLAGYDSWKYHSIAVEASLKIKENGWSVWQLEPDGQIISGISSIFYTIVTPKPWVLLPVNSLLHGLASIALFEILNLIIENKRIALFSLLPFVLFPSSLLWNAQIHNENYVIPAVALFLFGLVYLVDNERALNLKRSWIAILSIILGSFIVWQFRDAIMSILHLLALISFFAVVVVQLIRFIYKRILLEKLAMQIGLIALILFLSSPFIFSQATHYFLHSRNPNEGSLAGSSLESDDDSSKKEFSWTETIWLPKKLDKQIKELAETRVKFIRSWSHAGSQIDTDIKPGSAVDVILYMPRALEIGFLSPFPSDWFTSGHKKAANLMRAESAFEMMIVYISILGLPYLFWHFHTKIEVWILTMITTGMVLIYAIAIPNVGSLYRFRYVYLMPLVCLGICGIILLYQKCFRPHRSG